MGWGATPKDADGDIINDPADYEVPPNVSDGILLAQESFPALGPTWNAPPDPNKPFKHPPPRSHLADPGRTPARVEPASTSKGDQDFVNRCAMTLPTCVITVSEDQVQLAGREPARGWPPYSVLYPDWNPTEVTHNSAFNPKNFWRKDANEGWIAGSAMDPLAEALKAAQAM